MSGFYAAVLRWALGEGWMRTDQRILVLCAGPVDRDTFAALGFRDVVVTNMDERYTADGYRPYEWRYRDAEALDEPDDSVDWTVVHAGLHHCASPHRGLAEMLRVARVGTLAIEARDSLLVRAAVRAGLTADYEIAAVVDNGGRHGGVRNTGVPNHVYRWTEREVHKAVRSLLPGADHDIRFRYGLRVPPGHPVLGRLAQVAQKVAPRLGNEFAFVIRKNVRPKPWLTSDGHLDEAYAARHRR